ncbi:MAG TPA: C40 family peptidase [Gaiellales bacterium]
MSASAQAIFLQAPGAAPAGTELVLSSAPAVAGAPYAQAGAVRAGWARANASKAGGTTPSAASSVLLRRVRLLGGAVQARKLWTSVALTTTAGGSVEELMRTDVHGLVVLGHHVHPRAGHPLRLGDWGTLTRAGTARSTATGHATAAAVGVRIVLLRDHAGLAAGSVIALGTVTATVAPPAPATGGGKGSGGNGGGSGTAPPPPSKTHRPKPAHHHHAAAGTRPHHRVRHRTPAVKQAAHALIAATAGGRARVLAAALEQVGWPYIWGGDSRAEGGFDCSGLVDYAYARAGMPLPGRPTAAVLFSMSTPVTRAHLAPGDLAFLYSRHRAPYHVALYAGEGLVVVAPQTGADVRIEPISAVPWDGFGRLLAGSRGDGLARSVAAVARRFAHPGAARLAAARRADALAARRVESAGERFDTRLRGARVPVAATTRAAAAPRLVALASVGLRETDGGPGVAAVVLLVLLAGVCLVGVPALPRRPGGE